MEMEEKYFDREHHLNDEGVALYVDALRLSSVEQLPPGIREHVGGCLECKKNVTGLFALLDDSTYGRVRSHPTFRLDRGRSPRTVVMLRMAAVVAGVAFLGTLAYFLGPFRQSQITGGASHGEAAGRIDSVQKRQRVGSLAGANNALASAFDTDPGLEDLVNGGSRSEAFVVKSPANGAVLGPGAIFAWKSGMWKTLTLNIMDNTGQIVLTERGVHTPFLLNRSLRSGLYYWRIESESDLLHVGKFIVK